MHYEIFGKFIINSASIKLFALDLLLQFLGLRLSNYSQTHFVVSSKI